MLMILGALAILLVVVLVLAFVVFPAMNRNGDRGVAENTPVPAATETLAEVVDEGEPSPVPSAKATVVVEDTSAPAAPTKREDPATPVPTIVVVHEGETAEPKDGSAEPSAADPTLTPTPLGGTGSGENLPTASTGLPWLIPLGAVLLIAVSWWRWRRQQTAA